MRRFMPDFARRRMTYADLLEVCRREGIVVDERPSLFDEMLTRHGRRPRIILNAWLSEPYKIFAGFHALGHWVCHPGPREFYLGSPGWLDATELEASTIGYLAIDPYPGPPYPLLLRAEVRNDAMCFWVEYPERQANGRVVWRPPRILGTRRVGFGMTQDRPIRLHRFKAAIGGQLELEW
jgi:hypothetical protein